MKVLQVLVTWFNRPRTFGTRPFTRSLEPKWLQYRWNLMETYTIPSLAAQTNTGFDWVVLCHEDSPAWMRERAAAAEARMPFRTFFDYGDVGNPYLSDLKERSSEADAVLVTRIDSDDMFHRHAMERIRAAFLEKPFEHEILNFSLGYQYEHATQRLGVTWFDSPPFSTRVWPKPCKDPLDHGPAHNELPRLFSCREIGLGIPYMVLHIHDENDSSHFGYDVSRIPRPLSRRILAEGFGVQVVPEVAPLRMFVPDLTNLAWQVVRTRHPKGPLKP
jgi:Putative rhamnosyl transferase